MEMKAGYSKHGCFIFYYISLCVSLETELETKLKCHLNYSFMGTEFKPSN